MLDSINLSKNVNKNATILKCTAKGFPYPQYEWSWNDLNLGCDENEILLRNCAEHIFGSYRCRIWNEIPVSDDWKLLLTPDRQCRSEQLLDFLIKPDSIDLTPVSKDNCFVCSANVGHFSTLCGMYNILYHILRENLLRRIHFMRLYLSPSVFCNFARFSIFLRKIRKKISNLFVNFRKF